jgi:hypothetical protein
MGFVQMTREEIKKRELQLKSHGILLELKKIGYTEIPECKRVATHIYKFRFCREVGRDSCLEHACQSHYIEIEKYMWKMSSIALNFLFYFENEMSPEQRTWAEKNYNWGAISSQLETSPVADEYGYVEEMRKRYNRASSTTEKHVLEQLIDSEGNLRCANLLIHRIIYRQFVKLFSEWDLTDSMAKQFGKKPNDKAPNGYVLDITKGPIPEISELFRNQLRGD